MTLDLLMERLQEAQDLLLDPCTEIPEIQISTDDNTYVLIITGWVKSLYVSIRIPLEEDEE